MFDHLASWLEIDSTTGGEADFLRHLEAEFQQLGFDCRRQSVASDDDRPRWNLIATATRNPSCLFSTHVDTVPPHLPVHTSESTIYGRGACDTKGGLAAMVRAAERLLDDGLDDLGFLLVVGEEVDHRGAKAARSLELDPDRILLCEPTRNRVISGQKGMIKVILRAEGEAAHSAFPDQGRSALHPLIEVLRELRAHPWPADELLGQTTLNVGTLSGGVAANVLAPSAEAELVFRTVSDSDPLLETVRSIAGDRVGLEVVTYNDPIAFDPPDDLPTGTVPFNTDAPYLAELGPIWLVGPGDIRVAHSDDEHLTREALHSGIDRYEHLARRLLESPRDPGSRHGHSGSA